MNNEEVCLECGGTGTKLDGTPCLKCAEKNLKIMSKSVSSALIPFQYQGLSFDKSFLPTSLQKGYGDFMEDLLQTISIDYAVYQLNLLICSRPNSGKTVWSYNLINLLSDRGYKIPTVQDLIALRDILNHKGISDELYSQVVESRGLIVRIPADMQFWMFDIIQTVIEKRIAKNGFTIFLYSDSYKRLQEADKYNKLQYLLGAGSYHTIRLEDFSNG